MKEKRNSGVFSETCRDLLGQGRVIRDREHKTTNVGETSRYFQWDGSIWITQAGPEVDYGI